MKKIIFVSIFVLPLLISSLYAQTSTIFYSGEIGNIAITMHLTFKMSKKYKCKDYTEYSGFYYYNKYKKSILIEGSFNPCGVEAANPDKPQYLRETYNGECTGSFELFGLTGNRVTGFWESPDGKKKLKVVLTKVE